MSVPDRQAVFQKDQPPKPQAPPERAKLPTTKSVDRG